MLTIKKHSGIHHEDACSLIKRSYESSGYTFSRDDFMNFNIERTLFTLTHRDMGLVGTISLIKCLGKDTLPLSSIYGKELEALLKKYTKVYEVSGFAVDKDKIKKTPTKEAMLGTKILFKAVYAEAIEIDAELLLITISPKHSSFYKLLGFEEFGEPKLYPFVNTRAIAMKLNLGDKERVGRTFLSKILF